jgi:hypothetical protein
MSLRRLRAGELIALLGAVGVIVALTRPWYQTPVGNLSAWHTFGPTIVLLMLAAALAVLLAIVTITERSTALPVALAVWTTLFGLIAVVCAVVRLLERPHSASDLCAGPWLAFAGAILILLGAWQSMRDERPSLYEAATPERRKLPEGDSEQT